MKFSVSRHNNNDHCSFGDWDFKSLKEAIKFIEGEIWTLEEYEELSLAVELENEESYQLETWTN